MKWDVDQGGKQHLENEFHIFRMYLLAKFYCQERNELNGGGKMKTFNYSKNNKLFSFKIF